MALCIVTANEEPQDQEAHSELEHSDEPNLNVSLEAQSSQELSPVGNLTGMSDFLITDTNASIGDSIQKSANVSIDMGGDSIQKSALKADVPEASGAEEVNTPEEEPRLNVTDQQQSGRVTIEGDSIRHSSSGKVSHTFFAKVNTGIFVNSGENRTLTPSSRPKGTEVNPTVLPKDVNQNDTEKVEEPTENDKVKAKSNGTLERSELYNREPVPIDFQHHHRDISGCAHQSCDFPVSGREGDDTYIEDDEAEPKISVRMLMAPTDEYFYMSSDTLQDLWQNHINADSSLPLDIIETSANELIEYYQLPPDPDFIVPVMTSPPATNDERVHQYAEAPELMPQQPVFDTAQNKEGLPDESHYLISFPTQQVLPTAAPGTYDQVLPRPPTYYDAPSVLQGLYPIPIYTTPAYTQMTGSPSNVIRNYIQQPPEYRNIPSSSVGGLQFHPGVINQTLLSMGISNILENVRPSFVVHSPTDMPTLQLINAVTGMVPGLMMEHGSGSFFPDIYGRGTHVRFPKEGSPLMPQPTTPPNGGGVMETPKWERDDSLVHTVTDDKGDTHVIIRIKSPSTTTTKQPVTAMNVPDTNGYSEITLEDGKKILIRVQDEKKEASPIQPPVTQPSNPLQGTSTQNYIRNNPKQKIRPMMPRVTVQPKRRIPSQSRPADDRFSSTGLASIAEDTDRIFIKANLGNLLNKGDVGGILNKGVQGSGYGMGNMGSTYNTGYGGASTGMGIRQIHMGWGILNPPGMQNYGATYGSGGKGNIFNKGSLVNLGGKFNIGGLGNIFNDLKKNNPFSKGNLQNIFNKFNKGSPFGGGGLGSLTDKFSAGNLFDKGSLNNIKNEITNSVGQVQNKFQKLVGPLQTQVDTSFESAVGFLQMFFSQVIPGDYYENVLTILAILAFIAFVSVRLSLMFNSLGSSVTFSLFGRAEEVLNSIKESDQVQVMQDLASDVYKSIELWAQENLEMPSSGISNLFFIDQITSLFGFGKSSKETVSSNVNGSNLVKKTLLASHNDSLPGESTRHDILRAEIFEELEGAARLGSTLVDLTWRAGGRHSPVSETSCLQRPLCDLNAISDQEGGLSSLLVPLASTGVSWLTRPSENVFALLETFRPLWLSNTLRQGEGCRRIHPCERLT
ncbi:LOW QUALITY PROTEIN: uncharacterized protein [Macrobrachium rosenbergii]|uniref:LOW QUALITY PROTEIN: uncharacterized protein n=1 Tax=Macrobrachium rosenbergii TaxID=79674 RepID=UPI0034D5058B